MSEQPRVTTVVDGGPSGFECVRSDGHGTVALVARGHLTVDDADGFRAALRSALSDAVMVTLDLRHVDAVDAAGVYVIAQAGWFAGRDGKRVVLVLPPDRLDEAFGTEHGDGGFTIVRTGSSRRG